MMRILRKWGVIAAVVVVCAAVATFGQVNNAGSYISELRQTLRLRLGPDNVDAYISRGNAKGERGQFEEAIADYDQALQLQPDNAFAYDHRGFAKIALGQFEEAVADYDQALQLRPDFAAARLYRGLAKFVLDQYEEAVADLDQALHLWPDDAFAYVMRGEAKICLGQYQEAVADFDQALQLQPDDVGAYLGRANARTFLGQYDDAFADLDRALHLEPDNARAYLVLGGAKTRLGQYEDAFPDQTFAGEISRIDPFNRTQSGAISFPVTIRLLDNALDSLLPGMTAVATLKNELADDRWLVPSSAIQEANGETIVTVVRGQEHLPVAVTPEGLHGEWTIVRSVDLKNDDEVLGTTATFMGQ